MDASSADPLTSPRLVSAPSVGPCCRRCLGVDRRRARRTRTLAESVEHDALLMVSVPEAALRCATTLAVCGERREAPGSLGWNGGGVATIRGGLRPSKVFGLSLRPKSLRRVVGGRCSRPSAGQLRWALEELQTLSCGIGATSCGGDADQRLLEFVAKSIG